jgi:hypothetical protein
VQHGGACDDANTGATTSVTLILGCATIRQ